MKKAILLVALVAAAKVVVSSPVNLKVNYIENPLGIDKTIYFSWELDDLERGATQTAYQILVASDPSLLNDQHADLWNSGRKISSQSIQIKYNGKEVESATKYYWKVISWDKDNTSNTSQMSWFETGLLNKGDWKGSWIGDGKPVPEKDEDFYERIPAPHLRKEFNADKKIKQARLYISGLGYHEIFLNGEKVRDYRLEPGWTQFSKTVYYNVHDVTAQLNQGENTIGVILGNGWYNPSPLRVFSRNLRNILTIGKPKLLCQLKITYDDGTSELIVSDESWKTKEGPIVRNNVYLGEWYDAREELPGWCTTDYDDSSWSKAVGDAAPEGLLTWQFIPPIRNTRELLKPFQILEPKPGTYVYDLGQNFAGVIRFKTQAPSGTEIVFRYAEQVYPDHTIDVNTTAAGQIKWPGQGGPGAPDIAWQEDRYICKGEGIETFEPRFTFHGFRYVEVTGLPSKPSLNDLVGIPLNSDIKDISEFECSNGLFNKIQHITEWAMLSNVFSIESDCPAREKFGYGGDMVTVSEAYLYNYDMTTFYQKSVRDFDRDALPNGAMTECAPNIGINQRGVEPGTGSVGWTLAHPFLLYQLYKYYGNLEIVEEQYPSLKRLVDFYNDRTPDYLILDCIGDHNSVDKRPTPVSAAVHYYHHVIVLAELAKVLGKDEDVKKYSQLAENIKKAFIEKFVDTETGKVYSGYQASQIFALYYDLVPEETRRKAFKQLEDQILIDRKGHLTTGIFSTKIMLNYLSDHYRDDLSFIMLNQKTYPGYGYMIDKGATTLWENWEKEEHDSKNHPMFGSVSEWFYKSVLGIQQAKNSIAFSDIVIRPSVVGDLTWAQGSYHSVKGKISSSWWKFEDDLHIKITIPANTKATIYIPILQSVMPDIYEGNNLLVEKGKILSEVDGVKFIKIDSNIRYAIAEVGSGTYYFVSK